MADSRVTLRDIAREVGVHPSTISRALNPATREMVTAEIAERTLAAAERLGYRPNTFAQSLKTNRSYTVGVLVPDLTNPVFPPIIKGIDRTLEEAGYTVVVANSDNQPDREQMCLERMQERRVDGLILATARLEDPTIERCLREKLPFVLVNRTTAKNDIPSVVADETAGIKMLVQHLTDLGHRRIAMVSGPHHSSTGLWRFEAYVSALRDHGLEFAPELATQSDTFTEEDGQLAAARLLQSGHDFTAIIAGNDMIALGCLSALKNAGLKCPDDISLAGFNDMRFIDRIDPPLTTIRIPLEEMGSYAARMLLGDLNDDPSSPQTIRIVPRLMVRSSTGPAK
ncbi:MAG: LacI family DNA-binding transcriptional regulator [Proteobacteria bacterium]|nr:LacI family DNA-binding transcriptional regulator [Pseudomonadota bacterium]